jgi:hypothetical protein
MKLLVHIVLGMGLLPAALLGQSANPGVNPAPGAAQGWEKVEALAQGDEITVTSARSGAVRCRFQGATETALYCDFLGPLPFGHLGDRECEFSRADVVKVRRRHFSRDRNITIAAFAVLGCAIGATGGGGPPGCLLGGFALGFVGAIASVIVFYWLPGKTIYEKGEPSRKRPPASGPQAKNLAYPMPALSE